MNPLEAAVSAYLTTPPDRNTESLTRLHKELTKFVSSIHWARFRGADQTLIPEAVEQIILKMKQFKGDSRFSTWAYRVAECVYLMRFRKEKGNKESSLEEEKEEALSIHLGSGIEASIDFDSLLKRLPPADCELLTLLRDGYTREEIRERMGLTEGQYHYKRKDLLTRLRRKLDGKQLRSRHQAA